MKRTSREGLTPFSAFFGMHFTRICEVNPKEHYLVTEHGTVYRVPEEFSRYMVQYQEDCLESLYDEYDGEETMTDEETGGMEN